MQRLVRDTGAPLPAAEPSEFGIGPTEVRGIIARVANLRKGVFLDVDIPQDDRALRLGAYIPYDVAGETVFRTGDGVFLKGRFDQSRNGGQWFLRTEEVVATWETQAALVGAGPAVDATK